MPTFCAGVILLLGVTLGGTIAVATAAYQLFIKPLPYGDAQQLVEFSSVAQAMNGLNLGISPAMFAELQQDGSLGTLAAFDNVSSVVNKHGQTWQQASFTDNLTHMLQVKPLLGRTFNEQDTQGSAAVALLSEHVWRNRYGGSENVLGQVVELEEGAVTIIGVLPDQFAIPTRATELWTPLIFTQDQLSAASIGRFNGLNVIGRLPQDMTAAIAMQQLQARYLDDPRVAPVIQVTGLELQVKSLQQAWTSGYRSVIKILSSSILLVLFAAALNLAGLWMNRALGRGHELAIQVALGSGRWVAVQSFLIEYLLLGIAGLLFALLLAPLILHGLSVLNVLDSDLPIQISIGPMAFVMAVAFLLLSAIPVLFAVLWQSRRVQQQAASELVSGGKSARTTGGRTRHALIVVQLAMAMSLLVTVSLLLQSWQALLNEDLGFDSQHLVLAQIGFNVEDLNEDNLTNSTDERMLAAIQQLNGLPGVTAATFTSIAPFSSSEALGSFILPDLPDVTNNARPREVAINYFSTLNIPVVQGLEFAQEHLSGSNQSMIVDQQFANQYFPGGDVIGQVIQYGPVSPDAEPGSNQFTIIGVVGVVKQSTPEEQQGPATMYFPARVPYRSAHVLIATDLPPESMTAQIELKLQQQLGEDRVGQVSAIHSLVRQTLRHREPQLILLAVFAAITVLLSALGIYALLSYSVKQRTAEFGVRLAIGANAWRIRHLVLGNSLRLLLPGLVLGAIGAVLGARLIADQLYRVDLSQPFSWVMVSTILITIVLLASLWPSEQAARTAPIEALRYE